MKLEIRNLEKIFRTDTVETVALNNVSFTINDGDFVAIMGPSGCGKSTLLNILGLLDNPTSGSYRLDGEEVGALKESARTEWRKGRIGFIFQSFNRMHHMPMEMSGGEQQRVAIARAIVGHPGLILADEPTGNLDSKNGSEVLELLNELHREGATIIMVTHSQRDAAHADYIINLFDGQIVESLNDKM